MLKSKITIEVNPGADAQEVSAIGAALCALGNCLGDAFKGAEEHAPKQPLAQMKVVDAEEVTKPTATEEKKTPASRSRKAPVSKEETAAPAGQEFKEAATEEATDEAPALKDAVNTEGITIDDIQSKAAEKAVDHRAEIKAEIARLGAAKIALLETKHYSAFYKFLENLKK